MLVYTISFMKRLETCYSGYLYQWYLLYKFKKFPTSLRVKAKIHDKIEMLLF